MIFGKGKLGISLLDKIIEAAPNFVGFGVDCRLPVELERELLKKKVLTFGNLVNVGKLPVNKEFMFYGFPLKIKGGDGSPIRAVAVID